MKEMALFTKDLGKMISRMVMELKYILMAMDTMDNSWVERSMGKELRSKKMEDRILVSGKMA